MEQTIENWYSHCDTLERVYARKLIRNGWTCDKPRCLSRFKASVIRLQLKDLLVAKVDNNSYVNITERLIIDNQFPVSLTKTKFKTGHSTNMEWPFYFKETYEQSYQ